MEGYVLLKKKKYPLGFKVGVGNMYISFSVIQIYITYRYIKNPDSVLFHIIYWLFFLKRAPLYAWGYVTSTHCQPYDRSSAKLQHKQPKVIIVYLGTQQMSEIGFK